MGLILSFLEWNQNEICQSGEDSCRVDYNFNIVETLTLDSLASTCTPIVPRSNGGGVQRYLDTFNYSNRDTVNQEPESDLDGGDHYKNE